MRSILLYKINLELYACVDRDIQTGACVARSKGGVISVHVCQFKCVRVCGNKNKLFERRARYLVSL